MRPAVLQVGYVLPPRPVSERETFDGHRVRNGSLGTAFFVNSEGYAITAQHVVDAARELHVPNPQAQVGIGLAIPNTEHRRANFVITGFNIIEEDPRHDLALVKLKKNPFAGELRSGFVIGDEGELPLLHGVPRLRPERPCDGDAIAISGYPLGEPVLVTNAGSIASSWSVRVGEIPHPTMPDTTLPEIRDVYLADVQSNPGNSGGPVYSVDDGSIIGVLVAGRLTDVSIGDKTAAEVLGVKLTADAGLSIVVPCRYVVDMLERNGIGFDPA